MASQDLKSGPTTDANIRTWNGLSSGTSVLAGLLELRDLSTVTALLREQLWEDFRLHADNSQILTTSKFLLFHQRMNTDAERWRKVEDYCDNADDLTGSSLFPDHEKWKQGESAARMEVAHVRSAEIDSIHTDFLLSKDLLKGDSTDFVARMHILQAVISAYRSDDARGDWPDLQHPFRDSEGTDVLPIELYSRLGTELALGGPSIERNRMNVPSLEFSNHASQECLKNVAFASLAVLLVENAVSASGIVSVWEPAAAGVHIKLSIQEYPGRAEVKLEAVHPSSIEGNEARHGLRKLAKILSKENQIEIELVERADFPSDYLYTSSICANIRTNQG